MPVGMSATCLMSLLLLFACVGQSPSLQTSMPSTTEAARTDKKHPHTQRGVLQEHEHSPYALVKDFLSVRQVHFVSLFTCSPSELLSLARTIGAGPRPVRWQTASGASGTTSLRASNVNQAAYANLSCSAGASSLAASLAAGRRVRAPWLVWSADPAAAEALEKLSLTVDADVTLVRAARDGQTVVLHDLFKAHPGAPLQARPVGWWRQDCGWSSRYGTPQGTPPASLARRPLRETGNLHGNTLRAAIVVHETPTDGNLDALLRALQFRGDIHSDTETRFGLPLAFHLAEMYNFTFQLVVTQTSGDLKNGSFDGVMGMLDRGLVDMGITPTAILDSRLNVVEFAAQTWKFRSCFIFRHPHQLRPHKMLTDPFVPSTWLAIGVVSVLTTVLLAVVLRYEDDAPAPGGGGPVAEALLVLVGLITDQGSVIDSGLVSGRCVLLVAMLLAIILQNFYSSAIVTFLLTPIPRTIRTVRDLSGSPLALGAEDLAWSKDLLQNSSDPLVRELYASKMATAWAQRLEGLEGPEGGFFPMADGIARVRQGGFAFFSEASTLYSPIQDTFTDEEKCSLHEVKLVPDITAAMPLPKGSPYKELVDRGLLFMVERGLRARQQKVWSTPRPPCEIQANAVTPVELSSILPALNLLFFGTIAAVLRLLYERYFTKAPTSSATPLVWQARESELY